MKRGKSNFKHQGVLTRKENRLQQLISVLIAYEGECTEPFYLECLVKDAKKKKKIAIDSNVERAKHKHTNPSVVLEDLLAEKKRLKQNITFEEYWIVIDRDPYDASTNGGHTEQDFKNAIEKSKKNGVKVAWSNPCFELWIVLHFAYRDTDCERHELQEIALNHLKSNNIIDKKAKTDDMKTCKNLYELLQERYDTAYNNAKKLYEQHGNDYSAPCTSIHLLTELLLNSSRE